MKDTNNSAATQTEEHGAEARSTAYQRELTLRNILHVWADLASEGVPQDMVVSTTIFAAFSNLVSNYGENLAAEVAANMADRIRKGDFSVRKSVH